MIVLKFVPGLWLKNVLRTNGISNQRLMSQLATATQSIEQSNNNDGTVKMNMLQAINNALDIAMENDDSAVVFGEDVGFGGVFRCSLNLQVINWCLKLSYCVEPMLNI